MPYEAKIRVWRKVKKGWVCRHGGHYDSKGAKVYRKGEGENVCKKIEIDRRFTKHEYDGTWVVEDMSQKQKHDYYDDPEEIKKYEVLYALRNKAIDSRASIWFTVDGKKVKNMYRRSVDDALSTEGEDFVGGFIKYLLEMFVNDGIKHVVIIAADSPVVMMYHKGSWEIAVVDDIVSLQYLYRWGSDMGGKCPKKRKRSVGGKYKIEELGEQVGKYLGGVLDSINNPMRGGKDLTKAVYREIDKNIKCVSGEFENSPTYKEYEEWGGKVIKSVNPGVGQGADVALQIIGSIDSALMSGNVDSGMGDALIADCILQEIGCAYETIENFVILGRLLKEKNEVNRRAIYGKYAAGRIGLKSGHNLAKLAKLSIDTTNKMSRLMGSGSLISEMASPGVGIGTGLITSIRCGAQVYKSRRRYNKLMSAKRGVGLKIGKIEGGKEDKVTVETGNLLLYAIKKSKRKGLMKGIESGGGAFATVANTAVVILTGVACVNGWNPLGAIAGGVSWCWGRGCWCINAIEN